MADPEIQALNIIWAALEPRDPDTRRRILEWAVAKSFDWPEYRIRDPQSGDFVERVTKHFEDAFGGRGQASS